MRVLIVVLVAFLASGCAAFQKKAKDTQENACLDGSLLYCYVFHKDEPWELRECLQSRIPGCFK